MPGPSHVDANLKLRQLTEVWRVCGFFNTSPDLLSHDDVDLKRLGDYLCLIHVFLLKWIRDWKAYSRSGLSEDTKQRLFLPNMPFSHLNRWIHLLSKAFLTLAMEYFKAHYDEAWKGVRPFVDEHEKQVADGFLTAISGVGKVWRSAKP